ncbi:MAG: hypothetical protein AB7F35_24555 [Acetobacteraceae bacterium]
MTRVIAATVLVVLCQGLAADPAAAWITANRWGGGMTHSWDFTRHTNAAGGSTSYSWGHGAEHTNMYGGTTTHAWGGGTEHTNVYGGSTYGAYGAGAVHTAPGGTTTYRPPGYYPPAYPAYHPPVSVPYYGSTCTGCAVAAGAVAGGLAGAAVASAASSNAYAAGVAAGSASAAAQYIMGGQYATLPGGCARPSVGSQVYYLCGNTWFLPSYGANGVYYRVVPAP